MTNLFDLSQDEVIDLSNDPEDRQHVQNNIAQDSAATIRGHFNGVTCVICQEVENETRRNNNTFVTPHCGHSIHTICCMQLFVFCAQENMPSSCPQCRAPLAPIDLIFHSHDRCS